MNDETAAAGTGDDPILAGRARAMRVATRLQRIGYLGFAAALVVFFVGIVLGLDDTTVTVIVACLGVGSAFLLPGILLAYSVKAARRDEVDEVARRVHPRAPGGGIGRGDRR